MFVKSILPWVYNNYYDFIFYLLRNLYVWMMIVIGFVQKLGILIQFKNMFLQKITDEVVDDVYTCTDTICMEWVISTL